MKTTIYLLIISLLFSCSKSSNIETIVQQNNDEVALRSDLWGFKVNPPNSSPASGILTGRYNIQQHSLSIIINYDSMTPETAHLHKGYFPDNGPIIKELMISDNHQINEIIALSESDANQLMNGGYYIDFHSRSFPEGEIRGQIEKTN